MRGWLVLLLALGESPPSSLETDEVIEMAERKILTLKRATSGDPARGGINASSLAGSTTPPQAAPPKKPTALPKKPTKAVKPKQGTTPRTKPAPSTVKATALLSKLVEDHPKLFPLAGDTTPWAIGIHRQIMTTYRTSKRVSRKALAMWLEQRGDAYKAALAKGGERIGLDGQPAGMVEA